MNPYLETLGSSRMAQKLRYFNVLSRPDVSIAGMAQYSEDLQGLLKDMDNDTVEQAEILMKYEGYILREKENAEKLKRLEDLKLNPDFNYDSIVSLGTEAREKLKKFKPGSIGQASRISGINPADISVLLVHMGR
jgi:tRNA uridine 5-carboxymethylaminomethyl modification enzyme